MAGPVYLHDWPTTERPAQVRRVEAGRTLWTFPLPPDMVKQSALLDLGDLWLTACPGSSVLAAHLCEVWRLDTATGQRLNLWQGEVWSAQGDAVVIVTATPKWVRDVDSFWFEAAVVHEKDELPVAGRVSARPNCGNFDVLGLRWLGDQLRLSLRDRCGVWAKPFPPR